jgi:hypothetical protein
VSHSAEHDPPPSLCCSTNLIPSHSCRTPPEQHSTTPPATITGTPHAIGELRLLCHRTIPLHRYPTQLAGRVRDSSGRVAVKTSSSLGRHRPRQRACMHMHACAGTRPRLASHVVAVPRGPAQHARAVWTRPHNYYWPGCKATLGPGCGRPLGRAKWATLGPVASRFK